MNTNYNDQVRQVVSEYLQREEEEGPGGAHDVVLGKCQHVRLQTQAPGRQWQVSFSNWFVK